MKTINILAKMQKDFKELYKTTKVIGISESSIHLSLEYLLSNFKDHQVTVCEDDSFPYKFTTEHDGVVFLALADKSELEEYKEVS